MNFCAKISHNCSLGKITNKNINFAEDLRGEINAPPAKKLEDLIHLAELCVDLLQQNEEHYAEVRKLFLLPLPHSLNVVF